MPERTTRQWGVRAEAAAPQKMQLIKELRESSGAPISDVKAALDDADYDPGDPQENSAVLVSSTSMARAKTIVDPRKSLLYGGMLQTLSKSQKPAEIQFRDLCSCCFSNTSSKGLGSCEQEGGRLGSKHCTCMKVRSILSELSVYATMIMKAMLSMSCTDNGTQPTRMQASRHASEGLIGLCRSPTEAVLVEVSP